MSPIQKAINKVMKKIGAAIQKAAMEKYGRPAPRRFLKNSEYQAAVESVCRELQQLADAFCGEE